MSLRMKTFQLLIQLSNCQWSLISQLSKIAVHDLAELAKPWTVSFHPFWWQPLLHLFVPLFALRSHSHWSPLDNVEYESRDKKYITTNRQTISIEALGWCLYDPIKYVCIFVHTRLSTLCVCVVVYFFLHISHNTQYKAIYILLTQSRIHHIAEVYSSIYTQFEHN